MPALISPSRNVRGFTSILSASALCIVLTFGAYKAYGLFSEPAIATWNDNTTLGNVDLFALINSNKNMYALSTYDTGLYRRIFVVQQQGDYSQANALIKRLHDKSLVGHVLYDRYMNSADYKANYAELRDWMANYGDQPDAYKIYQLAQKRRNNDPAELPAPQIAKKLLGSLEFTWLNNEAEAIKAAYKPNKRTDNQVHQLMNDVKHDLGDDHVTTAFDRLGKSKAAKMLTNIEYDSLLSKIAAGYFYNGKYDTSYKLSNQAAARSNQSVPYAHWIAGLSAWKNDDFQSAAKHFKAVISAHNRNPWMLSAAAFWAARSYAQMGDANTSDDWMHEAASYPRTFYGLIAQQKLGNTDAKFSWEAPELTGTLIDTLQSMPAGKRALGLMDIGQPTLAATELEQINPNGNKRIEKALIAAAYQFKMSDLAMRLGNAFNQDDGKLYDVALYPMVPWKGDASTGVNSALVNALIRQESKFSSTAQNGRTGAKGLMQLMPETAKFVSDKSYSANDLHKPEVNIVLGQRYIRHLLSLPQVQNNLIYLAAAYNAGPTNLAHWQKDMDEKDDPFMFVESIPLSETRAFVERVLTNYWIYNAQLKQETGTLESLGNGNWPLYSTKPKATGLLLTANY
jgi:soluble lytic murein transglycosylase-like protein